MFSNRVLIPAWDPNTLRAASCLSHFSNRLKQFNRTEQKDQQCSVLPISSASSESSFLSPFRCSWGDVAIFTLATLSKKFFNSQVSKARKTAAKVSQETDMSLLKEPQIELVESQERNFDGGFGKLIEGRFGKLIEGSSRELIHGSFEDCEHSCPEHALHK